MVASRNLRRVADRLNTLPRTALALAARDVESVAAAAGRAAGGPLRGKNRRPLPLVARSTVRPTPSGAVLQVRGDDPGAWVWRTTGTKPHRIRRRKSGKLARLTVKHPGSRGVGAWDKVVTKAKARVPELVAAQVAKVV